MKKPRRHHRDRLVQLNLKFRNKLSSGSSRIPIHVINSPIKISLASKHLQNELCKFLSKIRKSCLTHKKLCLDFSKVDMVHSCGTLLLLAEIDRIKSIASEFCKFRCIPPENHKCQKVFSQIGLLQKFGRKTSLEITDDDRDVIHWHAVSGTSVSPESADSMLQGIRKEIPCGMRQIVKGLGEAMTNCVQHAYVLSRNDELSKINSPTDKRWWTFAEVLDDWLHVVICDLGIGIARTLPLNWQEELRDFFVSLASSGKSAGIRDCKSIIRACELGRTRTDLSHRGKGLKDIQSTAQALGGLLNIYSGHGGIRFDFSKATPFTATTPYKRSIMGTVIQWSIPVHDEQGKGDARVQS